MIDFIFAVATEREKETFVPVEYWKRCVVTGIGYANVFRALDKVSRQIPIINVGYAGSNKLEVGKMYVVSEVRNYHPNCEYEEDLAYLAPLSTLREAKKYFSDVEPGAYPCYTSNDFVVETRIEAPVMFDMELYAILAMGFVRVLAVKYITDNLSAKEYEKNTGGRKKNV